MSEIEIVYEDDEYEERVPYDVVNTILSWTMQQLELQQCSLSCAFVSDATMASLNEQYRDKEGPTDILTFVDSDTDFNFPSLEKSDQTYLGDMIISLQSVQKNCDDFSVSWNTEIVRVLIHGMLHLSGKDHESNDIIDPMISQQELLVTSALKEFFRENY